MDFAWYIVGFVDGEGTFNFSFSQRSKLKTNLEIKPSFSVSQHKRNLEVIQKIKDYFGVGNIRFSKRDQNFKYEVRSLKDLTQKIIPFFKKHHLKTSKAKDFEIFSDICHSMVLSHHLNGDHLSEIIEKACRMNSGGKRKYTQDKLLKFLTR